MNSKRITTLATVLLLTPIYSWAQTKPDPENYSVVKTKNEITELIIYGPSARSLYESLKDVVEVSFPNEPWGGFFEKTGENIVCGNDVNNALYSCSILLDLKGAAKGNLL